MFLIWNACLRYGSWSMRFYVYIKPCDVWNNLSYLGILIAIIDVEIAKNCLFASLSFKTASAGLKYVNFSEHPGILQPEGDTCYRWQSRQPAHHQTNISFTLLTLTINCDWLNKHARVKSLRFTSLLYFVTGWVIYSYSLLQKVSFISKI